jgi:preprotein translocase subunit YajC
VVAFLTQWLYLAQAQVPAAEPDDPFALYRALMPIIFIIALFYFMLIRPQKKKEQQLRETISNLKENDRVITIGGIHGVVTNVKRDTEQLTIRVDEATGTKLKVNMSAIARVLTAEDPNGGGTSGTKS